MSSFMTTQWPRNVLTIGQVLIVRTKEHIERGIQRFASADVAGRDHGFHADLDKAAL
jgi:hypothetical protein